MTEELLPAAPEPETGGDPACWANRVCPACGAFNETPGTATCPTCGRNFGDLLDE